jgi:hypothetical protein
MDKGAIKHCNDGKLCHRHSFGRIVDVKTLTIHYIDLRNIITVSALIEFIA